MPRWPVSTRINACRHEAGGIPVANSSVDELQRGKLVYASRQGGIIARD